MGRRVRTSHAYTEIRSILPTTRDPCHPGDDGAAKPTCIGEGEHCQHGCCGSSQATGCQQSVDEDTSGEGITGFAIAMWFCILATTVGRALTNGGKWPRWCAWTGVICNALCETSGTRTEKSRVHGVPAAGQGHERVTCSTPFQGQTTKEEVCLKALLLVGLCHHEQTPRARG